MRTLLLLQIAVFAFLISCSVHKEPQIVCGNMEISSAISVEMKDSQETDNRKYELYGVSIDEKYGEPAPFVKIIFRRNDGAFFGVMTDMDGLFKIELEPGIYQMECSYAGYITYTSEHIAIDGMREKMQITLGK